MIYIAVLCNPKITAEPLYSTPLFIGPYAAANNTALLARRPSQGTKLYCLVNRGTFGVNNNFSNQASPQPAHTLAATRHYHPPASKGYLSFSRHDTFRGLAQYAAETSLTCVTH